jgi:hypothetical protein
MIVSTYRIDYRYGETIKLMPLFCAHLGSANCDEKKLKQDIAVAAANPNHYLFGGGDLNDMVILADTKRYTKANDICPTDDIVDYQIDRAEEILDPMRGRIIGLGEGNHEEEIAHRCGTNPSKRLAKRLNTTYLGYSGLIRLQLSENGARGRTVDIRWHHGWGGGGSRTRGYPLTKYSKDIAYWKADLYLYGHDHQKQDDRIVGFGIGARNTLCARDRMLVVCGTYLKTYTLTEYPTYGEKAGYPPVAIGCPTINITPNADWVTMSVDS